MMRTVSAEVAAPFSQNPGSGAAGPGPDSKKVFRGRPARGQTSKRLYRASGPAGPGPDLKKVLPGLGAVINWAQIGARFYSTINKKSAEGCAIVLV